jgi:hypothetical protein
LPLVAVVEVVLVMDRKENPTTITQVLPVPHMVVPEKTKAAMAVVVLAVVEAVMVVRADLLQVAIVVDFLVKMATV